MAAFELCFSIRKEFLKEKVSGEISFELISLFHVQIQKRQTKVNFFMCTCSLKLIIFEYCYGTLHSMYK